MTLPLPLEKMCPSSESMEEKPTIKRRRTEIELIKDNSKRQVTFTKRRQGLIRKARDLSEKCDAEIAIMVVSAAGNFYAFGNPTFDGVVERYKAEKGSAAAAGAGFDAGPDPGEGSGNSGWREDGDESPDNSLDLTLALPSEEKATSSSSNSNSSWDSQIDNMNLEELQQLVDSMEEKKKRVIERANQIARYN